MDHTQHLFLTARVIYLSDALTQAVDALAELEHEAENGERAELLTEFGCIVVALRDHIAAEIEF